MGKPSFPTRLGAFGPNTRTELAFDSWAAALGVGEAERNFLGRWKTSGATNAYVRTALRALEDLQVAVAHRAREAAGGGPDFLGEELLLDNFRAHLEASNWAPLEAQELADSLQLANYKLKIPALQ